MLLFESLQAKIRHRGAVIQQMATANKYKPTGNEDPWARTDELQISRKIEAFKAKHQIEPQVDLRDDPWQVTGVTADEAATRISQYNRLLDFLGGGQGRWGRGWEASFDVDSFSSWVFQCDKENNSKQFDWDTPHEEILVWIVRRFYEEVPY
jgi:hypothetical protein